MKELRSKYGLGEPIYHRFFKRQKCGGGDSLHNKRLKETKKDLLTEQLRSICHKRKGEQSSANVTIYPKCAYLF